MAICETLGALSDNFNVVRICSGGTGTLNWITPLQILLASPHTKRHLKGSMYHRHWYLLKIQF